MASAMALIDQHWIERMDAAGLEHYLHHHIPISRAMGITVVDATPDAVALRADLEPNLNHRSTAFGGSVGSLGVLAGWSLLRIGLDGLTPTPQIVIQRSSIEYVAPVLDDFEAVCQRPPDDRWQRFLAALERRGRGRIEVDVDVRCSGTSVGSLRGTFVAIAQSSPKISPHTV